MANSWINIYKNNPTAGGVDGTAVSTDGDFTSPLTFALDASQNESGVQKCAIRTESGFKTYGETTITDLNDDDDRWKFCKTADGEFTDEITFTEEITNQNVIFYVKAGSSDDESPKTDRSVQIKVTGQIATVA